MQHSIQNSGIIFYIPFRVISAIIGSSSALSMSNRYLIQWHSKHCNLGSQCWGKINQCAHMLCWENAFEYVSCHFDQAPMYITKTTLILRTCECLSLNSSDSGGGLFRLWGSIPCLLMPWLLKWPEHQLAWYWLCWADNMSCCSRFNFIYLDQAKSKKRFKIGIYLL